MIKRKKERPVLRDALFILLLLSPFLDIKIIEEVDHF